jgi:hypothetical protein
MEFIMAVPEFKSFEDQEKYLSNLTVRQINKQIKEEEKLEQDDPQNRGQHISNKYLLLNEKLRRQ